MHRIGLIATLFILLGQSQASISLKTWEINALTDSNCVGILSDQGEAAAASNLSECTTGCLKKIASIRRTQNPFSGYIYLMCRVLAHVYLLNFYF